MSFPSIRECMLRLEQLRNTDQIIADLVRLNEDLWAQDGGAPEINAALPHIVALHQLCRDLMSNIRNAGTPAAANAAKPNAPAKSKIVTAPTTGTDIQRGQEIYHAANKGTKASAPAHRVPRKPVETPPGYVNTADFRKRLGLSQSRFHALVSRGDIARPSLGGGYGKPAYWAEEAVEAIVAYRLSTTSAQSA